jgi:hypothetical protein
MTLSAGGVWAAATAQNMARPVKRADQRNGNCSIGRLSLGEWVEGIVKEKGRKVAGPYVSNFKVSLFLDTRCRTR